MKIGYDLLVGKTTLSRWTVIDIECAEGSQYQVFDHQKQQVRSINIKHEDVFAVLDNGINNPETQDEEGRFDVFGNEEDANHYPRWDNGTKVKFQTKYKDGSLEIMGFIVRNFWGQHYLISEVGVSVPNRHWKVQHSLCEKV